MLPGDSGCLSYPVQHTPLRHYTLYNGARPHQDINAGFPRPDNRRLGFSTQVSYTSEPCVCTPFVFFFFPPEYWDRTRALSTRKHMLYHWGAAPCRTLITQTRSLQIRISKKGTRNERPPSLALTTSAVIPCPLLKLCLVTVNKSFMLSPTCRNVMAMTSACLLKQSCPSKWLGLRGQSTAQRPWRLQHPCRLETWLNEPWSFKEPRNIPEPYFSSVELRFLPYKVQWAENDFIYTELMVKTNSI